MKILTFSGSSRVESSNSRLLDSLINLGYPYNFLRTQLHFELPMFRAELDCNPLHDNVVKWRKQVKDADAVIICIPEYIHNMPAVIKNALEWLTSSGELLQKKVIAITLTPHSPRGEKALESLVWSLKALDANIIVQLLLFNDQFDYDAELNGEGFDLLKEALFLI